jgi:PhzF family phenazine biosynthesis protein
MPATRRFHQLDVFSNQPLLGNALAVVHDATGLDEGKMAAFARWTNLSETTFLFPPAHPDADYRVRIFTPEGELPFAGHPTLGSCYAWLQAGGKPHSSSFVVQECAVGLVKIRREGTRLAFAAPPLRRTGDVDEQTLSKITESLGIARGDVLRHQWVDNGPGWCAVLLASAEQVRQLKPDFVRMGNLAIGVVGKQAPGSDTDFEIRAFVPSLAVPEDPVTGSLNAGVAQWMMREGLAPERYVVAQGTVLQRKGRVYLNKIADDIWVGGDVVTCIEGHVNL